MPKALLSSVLPVLRNLPTDHPRQPMLPGLKRRPASLWPLMFLLALVILVAVSFWQISTIDEIAAPERSIATGHIIQIERIGVPNGAGQNFVKYSFAAGDKITTGNEIIEYRAATPDLGDEIRVSYDPSLPQDNYRAQSDAQIRSEQQLKNTGFIVGPIFALFWLVFMLSMFAPATPRDWLNWRRARHLYRNGEIAMGRVQFIRLDSSLRSPSRVGAYEIVATYKVDGVRLLATTRCNNAWLVNQLAPEVEVVVAYDPLRPERSVILEPFAF